MAAHDEGRRAATRAALFAPYNPFTSSPSRARWGALDTVLCGLGAAALVVCLVATSRHKYFWYDEVNSWNLVTDHSLRHMLAAIGDGADGAPPLYHVTAWLWVRVFGASELALRAWTCAGFVAAFALTWAIMRFRYSTIASALGAGVAFGMSRLVVYQVAEARFYGLLTALAALATYWFALTSERREITWRLWLAIALTHAGLVYTHAFGGLYSAAVLAAWLASDRLSGWWRPRAYAAVLAAWLAYVPWLPSLHRAAALAVRGSWIAVPSPGELVTAYGFRIDRLSAIVMIGILMAVIGLAGQGLRARAPAGVESSHRGVAGALLAAFAVVSLGACVMWISGSTLSAAEIFRMPTGFLMVALYLAALYRSTRQHITGRPRLLLVAGVFFAIPALAFAISHVALSVFLDRYFLPCTIAVAIVVADLADEVLRTGPGEVVLVRRSRLRLETVWRAAWVAFGVVLLVRPALRGIETPPTTRPGADIEAVAAPQSMILVETPLDFMPLVHYQQRRDVEYVLPVGPSPSRRDLPPPADFIYNYMGVLESHEFVKAAGNDGTRHLCLDSSFLIAQSAHTHWLAHALMQSAEIIVRPVAQGSDDAGRLLVAEPHTTVCVDGLRAR